MRGRDKEQVRGADILNPPGLKLCHKGQPGCAAASTASMGDLDTSKRSGFTQGKET